MDFAFVPLSIYTSTRVAYSPHFYYEWRFGVRRTGDVAILLEPSPVWGSQNG